MVDRDEQRSPDPTGESDDPVLGRGHGRSERGGDVDPAVSGAVWVGRRFVSSDDRTAYGPLVRPVRRAVANRTVEREDLHGHEGDGHEQTGRHRFFNLLPPIASANGRPEVSARMLCRTTLERYEIRHLGAKFLAGFRETGEIGLLAELLRVLILQGCPELPDRLRVDLAHPRLGHSEHLSDLCQRQALEVVERDHHLLSFGQRVDR